MDCTTLRKFQNSVWSMGLKSPLIYGTNAAMEIWSTSRSTTLWEHQPNTKIDRPCCMFKQSKSHNPRYFGNKGRELMNCYVQMCVKSVQILYTQKIVVYMLLTDNISNMHYTPLTCFA
ncbi:unnamed protein product [Cuscuta europaea]|uniref:Uncharacterized protein n=1 Tax=Cuscuta europaea TaxID=41803 RepID=A0A9P0ZAT4_CUSEU|nr:unnamed protein product [Cuscuta europaea]